MALTLATPQTFRFGVIGDNVNTVIVVDLANDPFNLRNAILRVTDLVVSGIVSLTATRTFSGTQVTLTFSGPWVGVAFVTITVLS